MRTTRQRSWLRAIAHRVAVLVGGPLLALAVFLVLPLIESITDQERADTIVRTVDTGSMPPPPAPPEPEPEKEPEPEDKPPELTEEAPPLDLSQLEMALDPGFGEGGLAGDYTIKLDGLVQNAAGGKDALFSIADLDQEPRALSQPGPILSAELRRKAPGTVHVVFAVDQNGRVQDPVVQRSTDPVFDRPALAAIKQWRFEPGKKAGKPVRFRMRVPITFPKN